MKLTKRYGYLWVTLVFFVVSISAHWAFAWVAYIDDAKEHNQPVEFGNYFNMTMRDTMENWQSEFLQLIWQVGGLSILWYIGSPTSKEGDNRKEELLESILKKVDPQQADSIIKELGKKYPKK